MSEPKVWHEFSGPSPDDEWRIVGPDKDLIHRCTDFRADPQWREPEANEYPDIIWSCFQDAAIEELARLAAELAEARAKSRIDEEQCNDMTEMAGDLAEKLGKCEAERDRLREANESVAVCADHVDLVRGASCWVCATNVAKMQAKGMSHDLTRIGAERDRLRAEVTRLKALLERANDPTWEGGDDD